MFCKRCFVVAVDFFLFWHFIKTNMHFCRFFSLFLLAHSNQRMNGRGKACPNQGDNKKKTCFLFVTCDRITKLSLGSLLGIECPSGFHRRTHTPGSSGQLNILMIGWFMKMSYSTKVWSLPRLYTAVFKQQFIQSCQVMLLHFSSLSPWEPDFAHAVETYRVRSVGWD